MRVSMTLTEDQYKNIREHLFPPDGCEAVSILLCGRNIINDSCRLTVHKICNIPYVNCSVRTPWRVKWCSDILQPILDEAFKYKLSIVKIHSHIDFESFSDVDNENDKELFPAFYNCLDDYVSPHASVILMHNKKMFGRVVSFEGEFSDLRYINVVGDNVTYWFQSQLSQLPEFAKRHIQLFGDKTFELLSKFKIGVVGCSGTGSPIIEQLARLGVGELVLVDPDIVEEKNLNRIVNSTISDVMSSTYKVTSLKKAIEGMGLGTRVLAYPTDVFKKEVVNELADCNFLFGCVDSVDARHLINRLSTFYIIPYIDLGIQIEVDGSGGVEKICGAVHYVQPGKSSLMSRKVFTLDDFSSAMIRKTDVNEYEKLLESKYLKGGQNVDKAAVISVNFLCSSIAMNEFLGRIHPFRFDYNEQFAVTRFELVNWAFVNESEFEQKKDSNLERHIGRGDQKPLINMPYFSKNVHTV